MDDRAAKLAQGKQMLAKFRAKKARRGSASSEGGKSTTSQTPSLQLDEMLDDSASQQLSLQRQDSLPSSTGDLTPKSSLLGMADTTAGAGAGGAVSTTTMPAVIEGGTPEKLSLETEGETEPPPAAGSGSVIDGQGAIAIASLEKEKKELEDSIVTLESSLMQTKLQLEEEKFNNSQLIAKNGGLEKDLQEVRSSVVEFERQNGELKSNLDKALLRHEEEKNQWEAASAKEKSELQLQIQRISTERDEFSKMVDNLQDEIAKNEASMSMSLNQQQSEKDRLLLSARTEAAELRSQLTSSEESIRSLQEKIADLENENAKLMRKLEDVSSDESVLSQKYEAVCKELGEAKSTLVSVEATYKSSQNLLLESVKMNEALEEKCTSLEAEVAEMNSQVSASKQEFETASLTDQERLGEFATQVADLKSIIERTRASEKDLAEKMEESEVERNRLVEEHSTAMEIAKNQMRHHQSELEVVRLKLDDSQSKIAILEKQLHSAKNELQARTTDSVPMQEASQLQWQLSEVTAKLEVSSLDLTNLRKTLTAVEEKNSSLAAKLQAVEKERDELFSSLKKSQTAAAAAESEVEEKSQLLAERDAEVLDLRSQVSSLSSKIASLQAEIIQNGEASHSVRESTQAVQAQLATALMERDDLRVAMNELEATIVEMRASKSQIEKENTELRAKAVSADAAKDTKMRLCDEALQEKANISARLRENLQIVTELREDRERLTKEKDEVVASLASLVEEKRQVEADFESQKNNFKKERDNLLQRIQEGTQLIQDLRGDLTSARSTADEATNTKISKVTLLEGRIKDLELQLMRERGRYEEAVEEKSEIVKRLAEEREVIRLLRADSSVENKRMESRVQSLMDEVETARRKIAELGAIKEAMEKEKRDLMRRLQEVFEVNARLRQERDTFETQKQESLKRIELSSTDHQNELQRLKDQLASLKEQLQASHKERSELSERLEAEYELVKSLYSQRDKALETEVASRSETVHVRGELEQRIRMLEEEHNRTVQEVQTGIEERRNLMTQLEERFQLSQTLRKEAEDLRAERVRLDQASRERHAAMSLAVAEAEAQLRDERNRVDILQREKRDLSTQLEEEFRLVQALRKDLRAATAVSSGDGSMPAPSISPPRKLASFSRSQGVQTDAEATTGDFSVLRAQRQLLFDGSTTAAEAIPPPPSVTMAASALTSFPSASQLHLDTSNFFVLLQRAEAAEAENGRLSMHLAQCVAALNTLLEHKKVMAEALEEQANVTGRLVVDNQHLRQRLAAEERDNNEREREQALHGSLSPQQQQFSRRTRQRKSGLPPTSQSAEMAALQRERDMLMSHNINLAKCLHRVSSHPENQRNTATPQVTNGPSSSPVRGSSAASATAAIEALAAAAIGATTPLRPRASPMKHMPSPYRRVESVAKSTENSDSEDMERFERNLMILLSTEADNESEEKKPHKTQDQANDQNLYQALQSISNRLRSALPSASQKSLPIGHDLAESAVNISDVVVSELHRLKSIEEEMREEKKSAVSREAALKDAYLRLEELQRTHRVLSEEWDARDDQKREIIESLKNQLAAAEEETERIRNEALKEHENDKRHIASLRHEVHSLRSVMEESAISGRESVRIMMEERKKLREQLQATEEANMEHKNIIVSLQKEALEAKTTAQKMLNQSEEAARLAQLLLVAEKAGQVASGEIDAARRHAMRESQRAAMLEANLQTSQAELAAWADWANKAWMTLSNNSGSSGKVNSQNNAALSRSLPAAVGTVLRKMLDSVWLLNEKNQPENIKASLNLRELAMHSTMMILSEHHGRLCEEKRFLVRHIVALEAAMSRQSPPSDLQQQLVLDSWVGGVGNKKLMKRGMSNNTRVSSKFRIAGIFCIAAFSLKTRLAQRKLLKKQQEQQLAEIIRKELEREEQEEKKRVEEEEQRKRAEEENRKKEEAQKAAAVVVLQERQAENAPADRKESEGAVKQQQQQQQQLTVMSKENWIPTGMTTTSEQRQEIDAEDEEEALHSHLVSVRAEFNRLRDRYRSVKAMRKNNNANSNTSSSFRMQDARSSNNNNVDRENIFAASTFASLPPHSSSSSSWQSRPLQHPPTASLPPPFPKDRSTLSASSSWQQQQQLPSTIPPPPPRQQHHHKIPRKPDPCHSFEERSNQGYESDNKSESSVGVLSGDVKAGILNTLDNLLAESQQATKRISSRRR